MNKQVIISSDISQQSDANNTHWIIECCSVNDAVQWLWRVYIRFEKHKSYKTIMLIKTLLIRYEEMHVHVLSRIMTKALLAWTKWRTVVILLSG